MQTYNYNQPKCTQATPEDNLDKQHLHAHRHVGSLTGSPLPPSADPHSTMAFSWGHSPTISCTGGLTTQRKTREHWARHVPRVTNHVTMARHVPAFELWNLTKERTGKTSLSGNRQHMPPSLRPRKFGRTSEELGCPECFRVCQDTNQFKPSISPTATDFTRKDHEFDFSTLCRINHHAHRHSDECRIEKN